MCVCINIQCCSAYSTVKLCALPTFIRLQTGTLTCNIMTFLKCTIQGRKHGEITVDEVPMEQEVATGKISRGPSPAPGAGVETGSRNVCEFSSAWI